MKKYRIIIFCLFPMILNAQQAYRGYVVLNNKDTISSQFESVNLENKKDNWLRWDTKVYMIDSALGEVKYTIKDIKAFGYWKDSSMIHFRKTPTDNGSEHFFVVYVNGKKACMYRNATIDGSTIYTFENIGPSYSKYYFIPDYTGDSDLDLPAFYKDKPEIFQLLTEALKGRFDEHKIAQALYLGNRKKTSATPW